MLEISISAHGKVQSKTDIFLAVWRIHNYNTTGGLTNMSPPHLTLQKAPWHVSHEDYTCHKELRPGGAHGHVGLPPAGSGFATAL